MCLNIFMLLSVALLADMGCGGGIPWLLGAAAKILLKGYFNKIVSRSLPPVFIVLIWMFSEGPRRISCLWRPLYLTC